jgi:hypothetical protein
MSDSLLDFQRTTGMQGWGCTKEQYTPRALLRTGTVTQCVATPIGAPSTSNRYYCKCPTTSHRLGGQIYFESVVTRKALLAGCLDNQTAQQRYEKYLLAWVSTQTTGGAHLLSSSVVSSKEEVYEFLPCGLRGFTDPTSALKERDLRLLIY